MSVCKLWGTLFQRQSKRAVGRITAQRKIGSFLFRSEHYMFNAASCVHRSLWTWCIAFNGLLEKYWWISAQPLKMLYLALDNSCSKFSLADRSSATSFWSSLNIKAWSLDSFSRLCLSTIHLDLEPVQLELYKCGLAVSSEWAWAPCSAQPCPQTQAIQDWMAT